MPKREKSGSPTTKNKKGKKRKKIGSLERASQEHTFLSRKKKKRVYKKNE